MRKVKVAVTQFSCSWDLDDNLVRCAQSVPGLTAEAATAEGCRVPHSAD